MLRKCLAFSEGFDPDGSPSLRKLKGSREFDELVRKVHRQFPVVRRARTAFVTAEKDLVPEGLAYDPKQRVFYLSSLNRHEILKIAREGTITDFVPSGRDNLLPVLGIRPDPLDGTVWAASWSEVSGKSELLHFDGVGRLIGRYAPDNSSLNGFNDLVVRKSGEVIVTDSASNEVYRFDTRRKVFTPAVIYRPLSAPNGITLADDDYHLFVADDFGIVRVDLSDGSSSDLVRGTRSTLAGIDGLYWYRNSLIAIQNGIGSPRVAQFWLSKDGSRVNQTTVLENRSAFTRTPTTGAISGKNFYFMANSQGDDLIGDRIVDTTKLERVRIGVLRLP